MSGRPSRFSSGKMPKTKFLPSSEIDRSKDSKLSELLDAIGNYWSDRAQRNRYYHDEWFVVLEEGGIPATRGLPLKKGSDVVFDDPTVEQIWERAARFREHKSLFSHAAYVIRRDAPEQD